MELSCMHGLGFFHLVFDFWWAILIFLSTPLYWFKKW
jgi:hypothetical protein